MKTPAFVLALLLTCSPAVAPGQEKKIDAGKLLGQTPESGSLPFWSKPSADARQELGKAARAAERGVFLLGYPKIGTGTGWVISKKHRLVVTNAHVADILHRTAGKLLAIPSGTSQVYKVEKAWYHPGVRRFLKNNPGLSVRSTDPKDGGVDPKSPDLAVLQLSADGPDLAAEFAPAAEAELKDLFAQPAAIFGFPGHDTKGWPGLGEEAAATYHDGVVSRLTDFQFRAGVPFAEKQFVQYTMSEWGGFSGSPVFLTSGHVAAVHNMARPEENKSTGEKKMIPHGVRVDCVLELLVHHGLEERVPFKVDKSKVLVERWLKPDPRTEKAIADFARAEQLVADARYAIFVKQEFEAGIKKCNEAIELVPTYAPAYQARAYGWNNYFGFHQNRLSLDDKLKYLQKAFDDIQKYTRLAPSDPGGAVMACQVKNNAGIVQDAQKPLRESLLILNELLASDNLAANTRAEAHSYRAAAHDFLDSPAAARRDHDEAIRLMPETPIFWENRGMFWEKQGRNDLAAADREKARQIRTAARTGMKITEVKEDGPAGKAGLRSGDIIILVGGKRVRSFDELTKALSAASGPVEIGAISADGTSEKTPLVTPVDGKIGVAVEPFVVE